MRTKSLALPRPGTASPLVAVATLALGGCGTADVSVGGFTIDTVAGVITVTNHDDGAWAGTGSWRLGTGVRIGADPTAEDAYAFGGITGLTVGRDGRIYVADGQAREVRVFAPDGEFLFRFGRPGEGPGEFGALDALATSPEGHIVARDPRLFRITRFSTEGRYLSDFRLQRPFLQYSNGLGFRVAEDGTIFDRLSITRGIDSTDSLALILYTPAGGVIDTVLAAESRPVKVIVTVGELPYMGLPVPFLPFASAAVGPTGAIARTSGDTWAFDVLDVDGSVQRTVRRTEQPVPVTAWERDSALNAMREIVSESTEGGRLGDFDFPPVKAAITHLLADAAGNWWVGANHAASRLADPPEFHVFDPRGRYLGRIAVPFRPIEIGSDYVAGVVADELGVESVVVAPLYKRRVDGP